MGDYHNHDVWNLEDGVEISRAELEQKFVGLLKKIGVDNQAKIETLQREIVDEDKARYMKFCHSVEEEDEVFTKFDEKMLRNLDNEHTIDCIKILALKHRILNGSEEWVQSFIGCLGIPLLVETIDNCLESNPVSINALFEVIQCIYRILELMNLEVITNARGALNAIVMSLDYQHGALAAVVLELLNAILMASANPDIAVEALDGLLQLSKKRGEDERGLLFLANGVASHDLNIRFQSLRFVNTLLMKLDFVNRMRLRKILGRAGLSTAIDQHRQPADIGVNHKATYDPMATAGSINTELCAVEVVCSMKPECAGIAEEAWRDPSTFETMQEIFTYKVVLNSELLSFYKAKSEEEVAEANCNGDYAVISDEVLFHTEALTVPVSCIKNIAGFCTDSQCQGELANLFRVELTDGTTLNFGFGSDEERESLAVGFDRAISRKKAQLSVWSKIETKKQSTTEDWRKQIEVHDIVVEQELTKVQGILTARHGNDEVLEYSHALLDFAYFRIENMFPDQLQTQTPQQKALLSGVERSMSAVGTSAVSLKPAPPAVGGGSINNSSSAAAVATGGSDEVSYGPDTTGLPAELVEKLPKLATMFRIAGPAGPNAVRQRMVVDGFSNAFIDEFIRHQQAASGHGGASIAPPRPPPPQAPRVAVEPLDTSGLTPAQIERLDAFSKMLKMKQPEAAVRQRMAAENIPASFIDKFIIYKTSGGGENPDTAVDTGSNDSAPAVPCPDTSMLSAELAGQVEAMGKLFKMLGAGTATQRMTALQFPEDFIKAFIAWKVSASGGPAPAAPSAVDDTGAAGAGKGATAGKGADPAPAVTYNLPARLNHANALNLNMHTAHVAFRPPHQQAVSNSRLWKNIAEVKVDVEEINKTFAVAGPANNRNVETSAVAVSAADDGKKAGAGPGKIANIADAIAGAKLKKKSDDGECVFPLKYDRYAEIAAKLENPALDLKPLDRVYRQLVELEPQTLTASRTAEFTALMPTEDEAKKIEKSSESERRNDEVCHLFEVFIRVPRYEDRLRCHLTVFNLIDSLPELFAKYDECYQRANDALGLITQSLPDIGVYLSYAISVLNYLNAGRSNAAAYAIGLEELNGLAAVRAPNAPANRPSYSVLHVIDEQLRKAGPTCPGLFFKKAAWDAGIFTLAEDAAKQVCVWAPRFKLRFVSLN
jgi:hypothetical protein